MPQQTGDLSGLLRVLDVLVDDVHGCVERRVFVVEGGVDGVGDRLRRFVHHRLERCRFDTATDGGHVPFAGEPAEFVAPFVREFDDGAMDIAEGTQVTAKRTGWDGSMIAHGIYPVGWPDTPDDDVDELVETEPISGTLAVRDGGYGPVYFVDGRSVDPATITEG